jgi:hypothetical protein
MRAAAPSRALAEQSRSGERPMIRTGVAFLTVALLATTGLCLIGASYSDRWLWFKAGLGVFMIGQAARSFVFSRALAAIRQRASVSPALGLRTMCIANVGSGGLFIVGAVTSLAWVLGLIVAIASLSWSFVWGWIFVHYGNWVAPAGNDMASEPGARNAEL